MRDTSLHWCSQNFMYSDLPVLGASAFPSNHYLLLGTDHCASRGNHWVYIMVTASHCLLLIGAVVLVVVKQPCLEIRSRQPFEEVWAACFRSGLGACDTWILLAGRCSLWNWVWAMWLTVSCQEGMEDLQTGTRNVSDYSLSMNQVFQAMSPTNSYLVHWLADLVLIWWGW